MSKTVIHVFNILFGIITIGFSLYFAWGVLAFGGLEYLRILVFPLSVAIVWSFFYYLQVRFHSVRGFIALLLVEIMVLAIVVSFIDL